MKGRRVPERLLSTTSAILTLGFSGICGHAQSSPESKDSVESSMNLTLAQEAEKRGTEEMVAGQMERALPYLSYAQRTFPNQASLVFKLNYTLGLLAGQEFSSKVLSFHLDGIQFSPDSKKIVGWSVMDRPAIIFSRRDTARPILTRRKTPMLVEIPGDDTNSTVAGAQFFGNGSVFLLRSALDEIDTEFGMQVNSLEVGRTLQCISALPGSEALICATKDGHLLKIQPNAGELLQDLAPPTELGNIDVAEMKRSSDGRFVVVIGRNGRVLYDLKNAICVRSEAFERAKSGVAFFPDGKHLLFLNQKTALGFLDAESGQISTIDLSQMLKSNYTLVSCAISPDGKSLAFGTTNGGTILFLVGAKSMLWLPSQMGVISNVTFSPNGKFLATAQSAVYLWDATTGRLLAHWLPQTALVHDLEFSPDSSILATAYDDGRLMVLDTTTRCNEETIQRPGRRSSLFASLDLVSPDGEKVLTLDDKHLLGLDVKGREPLVLDHPGEGDILWSCYSSDSQFLAISFSDCGFGVWRTTSGENVFMRSNANSKSKACAYRIGMENNTVVTFSQSGTIAAWDVVGQKELWEVDDATLAGVHARVQVAGNSLLLVDGEKRMQVRDLRTGSVIYQFEAPGGAIRAARLSEDGQHLAYGSDKGEVQVRSLGDDSYAQQVTVHSRPISLLRFSPSGKLLLSEGSDEKIKVTQLEEKKVLFEKDLHSLYLDALFPDACFCHGDDFICVAGLNRVLVLDSRDSQCLAYWSLPDYVFRVFASPDGSSFLASDGVGRVHRWSIPQTVDQATLERALSDNPWVLHGLELKPRVGY